MKFKFQSFFDVSTSATSMQVLQWSVGGSEVLNRCRHLFGAYKYFKLGKISVKMVPASTLPVDPQGLSYDADDPLTVDPRDQMNPGLVRITNGEDIFTNISMLTETEQENIYNTMMLDPRWSKFMLQSGFRRSAYPMYWQVGQLSQDRYPGATVNVPSLADNTALNLQNLPAPSASYLRDNSTTFIHNISRGTSSPRGLFQTGHRGKLGYLPTDFYQDIVTGTSSGAINKLSYAYGENNIPEVSVITCILPKAHKTLYYYRIFVTEEVYFAGLRSAPAMASDGIHQFMGLDNFIIGSPLIVNPQDTLTPVDQNTKFNNGGELP